MENNKKQTAVEQFIEQLEKQGESWENVSIGRIQISIKVEDYLKLKEQAKEMEKKEKIEFACQVAEASAEKYIQGKTTWQIAEEELLTFKSE
jgi:hypothetical protein